MLTLIPPNHKIATMARFITVNVTGLSIADTFPAETAFSDKVRLAESNSCFSSSCLEKARITLTPSRFSRVKREM